MFTFEWAWLLGFAIVGVWRFAGHAQKYDVIVVLLVQALNAHKLDLIVGAAALKGRWL